MKRLFIGTAAAALLALTACGPKEAPGPVTSLQITDKRAGIGEEAAVGKKVTVHYTGWLYDPRKSNHHGKEFDSSRPNHPFTFVLGNGEVIKGWEEGIAGMKEGGRRILIIPSEMAYGPTGAGDGMIPPNADLVFDVQVLNVR